MKMKFSSKLMSNVKILSYSRIILAATAVAGPIIYALVTGELTSLIHMSISRSDLVTLYQTDGGGSKGGAASP